MNLTEHWEIQAVKQIKAKLEIVCQEGKVHVVCECITEASPISVVRELDPMHSEVISIYLFLAFKFFFFFFRFLGLHPRHVEVPRLGVESELQLLA